MGLPAKRIAITLVAVTCIAGLWQGWKFYAHYRQQQWAINELTHLGAWIGYDWRDKFPDGDIVGALNLSKMTMASSAYEAIAALDSVYLIRIEGRVIDDTWWQAISASRNLEVLAIEDRSTISSEGSIELRKLSALHKIVFNHSTVDMGVIRELPHVASLKYLSVSGTNMDASWLPILARVGTLQSLEMCDVDIAPNDLLEFRNFPKLKYVTISRDLYDNARDILEELKQSRPEVEILPEL